MDLLGLGAIAGGVASLFGSGVNYAAQKDAIKWQKEQYYHNLEYNKPINQMARLAEAGINPHMAYSKGTINNIASPVPNIGAPQIDVPDFAGKIEQYVNMKKMSADIQNVEETNKNIQEQNKKIAAETRKAEAEARIAEHDAGIIEKTPFSSKANESQSLVQGISNYGGAVLDWIKHQVNSYNIEPGVPVLIYQKPRRKNVSYMPKVRPSQSSMR